MNKSVETGHSRTYFGLVRAALLILCFSALGCLQEQSGEDLSDDGLLDALEEEYFSQRVRFYPVEATEAGHHAYDTQLGSVGAEDVEARLERIRDLRQRLLGIDLTRLSRAAFFDALWLASTVKSEILDLEGIASWRRSPFFYSEIIRRGIASLLRGGAVSESAYQSLVSRLDQIPLLLETARSNIQDPPRLLVEGGLAGLRECRILVLALPAIVGTVSPPRGVAELGRSSREAARSMQGFAAFLETEVLPAADASFALGPERLRLYLVYREMEDTPYEDIRRVAEMDLRQNRARFLALAARMAPSRSPEYLLAGLGGDTLSDSELIPLAEKLIQELRRFTSERGIVGGTPPSPIQAVETPVTLLSPWNGKSASLSGPGLLGETPGRAYLQLPIQRPEWSSERREEEPHGFSNAALALAVIREVHPGGYLRYSRQRLARGRIAKLVPSRANRDGWGRYVEQMILDQGYGRDDPALLLMQLHASLVDQCRLIAAIGLHTEEMSLADAAALFHDEAYLDWGSATGEARALALDPAGLFAALGKRRILELRDEYLEANDASAGLAGFHEAFLSTGAWPIRLVRWMLLRQSQN